MWLVQLRKRVLKISLNLNNDIWLVDTILGYIALDQSSGTERMFSSKLTTLIIVSLNKTVDRWCLCH